jgi:tetratricopeptide (TPR) repeat protein
MYTYNNTHLKIILSVLFILCGLQMNGQEDSCEVYLDRLEKLLEMQKTDDLDSMLLLAEKHLSSDSTYKIYRYTFYKGLSFYYKKEFEKGLNLLSKSLTDYDSILQLDGNDYIKIAYYLAECMLKLNKLQESEETINATMVKCADIWEFCPYSMKMYKLLIDIYSNRKDSQYAIEQLHNERQLFAINYFDYRNQSKESNEIKKNFLKIHNAYKNRDSKDSIYYRLVLTKARLLNQIAEYEEAQICFEQAKELLSANMYLPNLSEEKKQVLYESIWNCSNLKDHKKVIELCDEYEKFENHQETDQRYIVYFNHGAALLDLHNYYQAIPLLSKTYSYLESQFSTQIPLFVMTAHYLGRCYYGTSNYEESIKYLTEGINIYHKIGTVNNYFLSQIDYDLGMSYYMTREYEKALHCLEKTAEIQQNINGYVDGKTNNIINECKMKMK